jgi:hypothetical protein
LLVELGSTTKLKELKLVDGLFKYHASICASRNTKVVGFEGRAQ